MEVVLLPAEVHGGGAPPRRASAGGTQISPGAVRDLRRQAREYGISAPQIGEEWGGMGLDFRTVLLTFVEADRRLQDPAAMPVDAPDEVHRRTIARAAFEDVPTEELERVVRYGE